MRIAFQDGREYTGLCALPWLIFLSPIIALIFGFALILTVVRLITRRDKVWGWSYAGEGTWVRVG